MGQSIRMFGEDEIYFVTVRTQQARYLLCPSAELNDVVGGILARAVQRHGVELYGFVFASNHVHLLVRARDCVLSRFMQYLLANVARKVGPLVKWSGTFWQGPYASAPVLDDAALEERLRYIISHGVKEGLVRRVEDWPGLSCVSSLLGAPARAFPWFNWTSRWKNGRQKKGADQRYAPAWEERHLLEVSVLPSWRNRTPEERRAAVVSMIESIESQFSEIHPHPLGPDGVLAKDPHDKPEAPKRSRAPLCHTVVQAIRDQFRAAYRAFRQAYAEASRRYRDGDFLVPFPPRAFRPPGCVIRADLGSTATPQPPRPAPLPSVRGKPDLEPRPADVAAPDFDRPAVLRHDPMADRQPEA